MYVFAQQWPDTYCTSLKLSGKECKLPPTTGIWTIHGIWPSRLNLKVPEQPSCCDGSLKMNVEEVKEQLKRNWPSISSGMSVSIKFIDKRKFFNFSLFSKLENPDEEFWEYEWLKHGTCGAFSSSMDYFNKALFWAAQYNMTYILAKSNILPNNLSPVKLIDIHNAVKSELKVNPVINCFSNWKTREQYLNEIRLCFNREFELIDCDGMEQLTRENVISNCVFKPIHYRMDNDDGETSGWFSFFAWVGLIVLIIVIGYLLKDSELRHRLFRTRSESRPFNNVSNLT